MGSSRPVFNLQDDKRYSILQFNPLRDPLRSWRSLRLIVFYRKARKEPQRCAKKFPQIRALSKLLFRSDETSPGSAGNLRDPVQLTTTPAALTFDSSSKSDILIALD